MFPTGIVLLSAGIALADPVAVAAPRFTRGDELVYRGTVVEGGERVDNRYRKHSDIEIRVFVLDARDGSADCAVLTSVRRRSDPHVVQAVAAVAGDGPQTVLGLPAVRVDLIRVTGPGRVVVIVPVNSRPPFTLHATTQTAMPGPILLDEPPAVELGMFVPVPAGRLSNGSTWDSPGGEGRPPLTCRIAGTSAWNGGRCVELSAVQQTTGWDRPTDVPTGWRRTETARISPDDGITRTVQRRIEHRLGGQIVSWVEVAYELDPPSRHVGPRYTDVRRDVEAAYSFAAEFAERSVRTGSPDFASLRAAIDRDLAETTAVTGYRPAIESVRRQCQAAVNGTIVATSLVTRPETARAPEIGRAVADFLAPPIGGTHPVRLASVRGRPAVLMFYRPGDDLTPLSLTLAEALHKRYFGRAVVLPMAVADDLDRADRERTSAG